VVEYVFDDDVTCAAGGVAYELIKMATQMNIS
jgi:hypothetical protein